MDKIPIILIKTESMVAIWPDWVMFKKMPKICKGSRGIITFSMQSEMMFLNSSSMLFRLLPVILVMPNPNKNAKNKAVIIVA